MPEERITVMDFLDKRRELRKEIQRGVRFVHGRITKDNIEKELRKYLRAGDILIDLAWNIECTAILDWCHRHEVLYINTSVELWDPYENREQMTPPERTLYPRHMAIRALTRSWTEPKKVTAILEHGANPGLVSHFTKIALRGIGEKILKELPASPQNKAVEQALNAGNFATLAEAAGVKVIHISEIDTQITHLPHDDTCFTNTWSVEGFYEEGTAPAELGWGTHEKSLPSDAWQHETGPRNQICLDRFGINTFTRSRVPSGEIIGMVVRHGEAFTISDTLTVRKRDGSARYRPTVHYAYLPSVEGIRSLQDLRKRKYAMQEEQRILQDDILPGGGDELGCLLMGHPFGSWWTGTILSIDTTRSLVPAQNATTLQVAASVTAAVRWMIDHPHEGVLVPDQLPHEDILALAAPYLGLLPSMAIPWIPGQDFAKVKDVTAPEHWQFGCFLLEMKNGDTPYNAETAEHGPPQFLVTRPPTPQRGQQRA
jgi:homospermidine synthase